MKSIYLSEIPYWEGELYLSDYIILQALYYSHRTSRIVGKFYYKPVDNVFSGIDLIGEVYDTIPYKLALGYCQQIGIELPQQTIIE